MKGRRGRSPTRVLVTEHQVDDSLPGTCSSISFDTLDGRFGDMQRDDGVPRSARQALSPELEGALKSDRRPVAFLFPGVGDHYPQMGRGLYEAEPVFRAEVDRCAELLRPSIGRDLREVLYPGDAPDFGAGGAGEIDLRAMLGRDRQSVAGSSDLDRTLFAHPAVFVV
jgi:acyl transferase domain-containing protein